MAHGQELIVNRQQQTPELLSAAADAGVPGVRGNSNASGAPPVIRIDKVEVLLGNEDQTRLVVNGIQSDAIRKPLARQINSLRKYGEL